MRFVKLALILGMMTALCLARQTFATEFAPAKSYAVGTNPAAVVVADFNGDGKLDLAVLNPGSNNVSVLLGNGDGTFQTAKNFDAGSDPSALMLGDFNGDGKLDLAVFMAGNPANSAAGEARILLGKGDGTFQAPVVTTLAITALTLSAGDFNGDKKADLIIGNVDPGTGAISLQILIGNGDGTFQAAKPLLSDGLKSPHVAIADFNKDGKLDLAVNLTGGIVVLQGHGDGTFITDTTSTPLAVGTANGLWTADLNNDGNVDLIVDSRLTSCSGTPFHFCSTAQNFGVLLGTGSGSFSAEQVFYKGLSFLNTNIIPVLAIGDFNGDGKLDVVYRGRAGASGFSIEVRLGKGDGTLAPPILLPDQGPIAAAQDFNGDKLSDVVTLDASNGNVNVLLNDSPASGGDLGIVASAASPEPVGVGTNLTYTADILNEGPQDATGVTFKDTLPASVTFVSATASQGTCSQSGQVVTCPIGALSDANDAKVAIVVTPKTAASITNNMDVSATDPDLATANNSANQTSTVLPIYTLTVTKSGNGSGTIISDQGLGGMINCGSACSTTYLSGATANLGDNIDAGSLLQSWGGACAGIAPNVGCSITMDSNKTVSTTIVLGVTLNVSITGGGTGSVTSADGSISCNDTGGTCSSFNLPGTQFALTATPSGGSQFKNWSGGCSGSNPNSCSVTLNSNQTVTATIAPPPDFSVNPATTSLAVKHGAKVSEVLTFPAQGGFSAAIALTCSVAGTAPMPSCGLSPNSVTPGSSSTLTVDAAALSAALAPRSPVQMPNLYAAIMPFGWLGLLFAAGFDKKRRRAWFLCVAVITASMLPAACGGGSNTPPPPPVQNYTVTLTATSGTIQHSTTISVTVN